MRADTATTPGESPGAGLLRVYDDALPQVYGYLLARCGRRELAEELTSETFLAAADAVRRERPPPIGIAWLIGVARHKLADHWRRHAREQRNLRAVASDPRTDEVVADPAEELTDRIRALETLARLAPQHRCVLTLRYVDDLPVAEVARIVERSLHATEALLVRARSAFRDAYAATEEHAAAKEGEGARDD